MGMNLYVAEKDLSGEFKVPQEFWDGLPQGEYVQREDDVVFVPNQNHDPIFHVEMNGGNAKYIIEECLNLKIENGMFDAKIDDVIAKIAVALLDPFNAVNDDKLYASAKLKEILDLCMWGKSHGCNMIYGA
ncbi:hypothetical protein EVB81_245 [Rhizobium phage RHph_I46]|uniref:Uncharacterized protein n=1 Tax=Rhizobium phage RHph_I1_9 TaxID=2509729 RepID=A0A7S5UWU8_9CAUD|nr:hypothetical protein PP936_gp243 [Rhizobium phage RHph_I1_9]QIG69814.1 hypothetical protein EVB81_245 [Rhizobium phage RHph_I46]QIG71095.1 hypothetical protein EVB92_245 [Rhizobium phage RHph_I9]QIG73680.1 hypothetical protein EVC04_243 [Rhizobium phage RHph_I1_9]QIG76434.1 hypothetical protein EVC25_245 [Rhizobium phage RHph_I34]